MTNDDDVAAAICLPTGPCHRALRDRPNWRARWCRDVEPGVCRGEPATDRSSDRQRPEVIAGRACRGWSTRGRLLRCISSGRARRDGRSCRGPLCSAHLRPARNEDSLARHEAFRIHTVVPEHDGRQRRGVALRDRPQVVAGDHDMGRADGSRGGRGHDR